MVELMVGMVLIGLTVLTVAALIQVIISISDRSDDMVLTTSAAQNKAESLRSMGFNSIGGDGTTVTFTNELPPSIAYPKSATYTVSVSAAHPDEKIVLIDIVGGGKHYKYQTVIGELGVGQY